MKAKTVLLCIIFCVAFLWIVSQTYAADLVSDPNPGCAYFDVEVNGAVVASFVPSQTDGSVLWNVDAFTPGSYTFRARCWEEQKAWPSAWSDPLAATKPGKPGNVKLSP